MNELSINIKNRSRITWPKFQDSASDMAMILLGANRVSKSSLEFQRLMGIDIMEDEPFVLLVNGDMFRHVKVKSLNIKLLPSTIVISLPSEYIEQFRGISKIVIEHRIEKQTMTLITEAIKYIFRGLNLEFE